MNWGGGDMGGGRDWEVRTRRCLVPSSEAVAKEGQFVKDKRRQGFIAHYMVKTDITCMKKLRLG